MSVVRYMILCGDKMNEKEKEKVNLDPKRYTLEICVISEVSSRLYETELFSIPSPQYHIVCGVFRRRHPKPGLLYMFGVASEAPSQVDVSFNPFASMVGENALRFFACMHWNIQYLQHRP